MTHRQQIETDCALVHAAARDALQATGIDLASVVLTLAGYNENGQRPRHRHFAICDVKEMADAAASWAGDGFNVYRPFVANRTGLTNSQRGGAADAVVVFGIGADLDADKGNRFGVDDLPLPATIVTRTSALPAENFNAVYLFTRAIHIEEAKQVAWGLAKVVADADGGTSDAVHVWRIAGTLNHPKASKIKRGRPAEPQAVVADPEQRGTGRAVKPEDLVGAIEVALGIESLAATYAEAVGSERIGHTSTIGQDRREPCWSGDHFDGNPTELARLVDALRLVQSDDRKVWREVVVALCDLFMGNASGEQIAEAWAGGGRVGDVVFPGCPEKFDAAAQRQLWRNAVGAAEFTVATVYHHAKKAGWNSSRAHWGLGRKQRPVADLTVAARGVQAAGLAMAGDDFTVRRLAWYWRVTRATKAADLRDIAYDIMIYLNSTSGIAFPSFERLSRGRGWGSGKKGRGFERASKAVRDLALMGFIVRSPGNERGAHGRIGPSFALCLPDGISWDEAVADFQAAYGNGDVCQTVATTRPVGGGSEDIPIEATRCVEAGSKPIASGSDPTSTGRVQTTSGSDPVSRGRVHLTLDMLEEKGVEREVSRPAEAGGGVERTPTEPEPAPATHPQNLAEQIAASPAVAGRDVTPWLAADHGAIPADVAERLQLAVAKGSKAPQEVALQLRRLSDLGLDDDQLRSVLLAASTHVVGRWAASQAKVGKQVDDADPSIVPPGTFCRDLAASLANHVGWAKERIGSGKLVPGARGADNDLSPAAIAREAWVAEWERKPTFKLPGTIFVQGTAAQLARAYPAVGITELKAVLGRASQPDKVGDFLRAPTFDKALAAARLGLLHAAAGGAPGSLVPGPHRRIGDYFALPIAAIHSVAARAASEHAAKWGLTKPDPETRADEATLALADAIWGKITRRPMDFDLDPSSYGHGLQTRFEEVFSEKLVEAICNRLDGMRQAELDRQESADALARGYERTHYGGVTASGLAAYRMDKAAGTLKPKPAATVDSF